MKITAADLLQLGVIHRIIYEPKGGAHRDHPELMKRLSLALRAELCELRYLSADDLRIERENFFIRIGSI